VARIDYLDDPNAPVPTRLAPGVNVATVNDHGQVLMICRADNSNWALPGGALDVGESMRQRLQQLPRGAQRALHRVSGEDSPAGWWRSRRP